MMHNLLSSRCMTFVEVEQLIINRPLLTFIEIIYFTQDAH